MEGATDIGKRYNGSCKNDFNEHSNNHTVLFKNKNKNRIRNCHEATETQYKNRYEIHWKVALEICL